MYTYIHMIYRQMDTCFSKALVSVCFEAPRCEAAVCRLSVWTEWQGAQSEAKTEAMFVASVFWGCVFFWLSFFVCFWCVLMFALLF